MELILELLYMSIFMLYHFQIITICLLILFVKTAIKGNIRSCLVRLVASFISIVILCGIPSGIMKNFYPEKMVNADQEITKEVASWLP